MEEVNKNTEVDDTDKKLHISDVMFSILNYNNVEMFIELTNNQFKKIFGCDAIRNINEVLPKYYNKTFKQAYDELTYIDRDGGDDIFF